MNHRLIRSLAVPCVTLALVAAGCGGDETSSKKVSSRSTTTSTTELATTTTVPTATQQVAPLTGLPATAESASLLSRPALAIKIDNSSSAVPQWGVNSTDLVFEIQVEGISRLMAVFHSADAKIVGPTRSARFSDPPILAMFGRPLFAWSGANRKVIKAVTGSPWIVNIQAGSNGKDFRRSSEKAAPHNLVTSTPALFAHAEANQGAPPQLWDYLGQGESNASAVPAAGGATSIAGTPSTWVWDAATSTYLRWEYGRRHTTDDGQASAANVVYLATQYQSGPTAVTVGSGQAMVLTAGGAIAGTWTRAQQTDRYTLTATDGTPIKLTPGRTWVELANRPFNVIAADVASGLLASGK